MYKLPINEPVDVFWFVNRLYLWLLCKNELYNTPQEVVIAGIIGYW